MALVCKTNPRSEASTSWGVIVSSFIESMSSMQISHGNKVLVESGVFLTMGEGITSIKFEHKDDHVNIDINVIIDNSIADHNSAEIFTKNQDTLELKLINYKQLMGNPALGPYKVGTVAGDYLYVIFRVSGTKHDITKEITYSFYIEESK